MAMYEVVRDIDVKRSDKTGFNHYYGRRGSSKGQMINDKSINASDLEWLRRVDALVAIEAKEKAVETDDTEKDKFGNEVYFCEKCGKNHRLESKIGKEHK